MRNLRTRIGVGTAVATFAAAAAFTAVSLTGGAAPADTVALTTTTGPVTTGPLPATGRAGTSLSVEVRKSTIEAGRLDVISGTLTTSAGNGRRIVELYRHDAKTGKWLPARVNLTRKGGIVRFFIRPLSTAEYQLVYHGNAKLAPSHSSPVTVTVTT